MRTYTLIKIYLLAVALALSAMLVSCQNQLVEKDHIGIQTGEDEDGLAAVLPDDPDPASARAAAPIDTAYQVRTTFKVSYTCSLTTASQSYKITEGNVTTPILSASAVTTAQGYRGFSIKADKFTSGIIRVLDFRKDYTVFMRIPGVPAVKKTTTAPAIKAIPATWKRCGYVAANPIMLPALSKSGKPTKKRASIETAFLICNL